MEIVAVPPARLSTLTTRWNLYKSKAGTGLGNYYRTLLQNTLNQCSADLGRSVIPPEGWEFTVDPDSVSLYPGINDEESPIRLVYPTE